MLTNMSTVKKSIERLKWLEGLEKSPEFKTISKKEFAALTRAETSKWAKVIRDTGTKIE